MDGREIKFAAGTFVRSKRRKRFEMEDDREQRCCFAKVKDLLREK